MKHAKAEGFRGGGDTYVHEVVADELEVVVLPHVRCVADDGWMLGASLATAAAAILRSGPALLRLSSCARVVDSDADDESACADDLLGDGVGDGQRVIESSQLEIGLVH